MILRLPVCCCGCAAVVVPVQRCRRGTSGSPVVHRDLGERCDNCNYTSSSSFTSGIAGGASGDADMLEGVWWICDEAHGCPELDNAARCWIL